MINHLERMYHRADQIDLHEGKLAYMRYHNLLQELARHYDMPFNKVVAAFVALSPNSDYVGNLRSLKTLLEGVQQHLPVASINVSTYRHCLKRAHMYLTGEEEFLDHANGLKIRSFYDNILYPHTSRAVTVDGHIYAVWKNDPTLVMKDAKVTKASYKVVEKCIQDLADTVGLVPCQVQAVIWFARKRILRIKYEPQLDLFTGADNH